MLAFDSDISKEKNPNAGRQHKKVFLSQGHGNSVIRLIVARHPPSTEHAAFPHTEGNSSRWEGTKYCGK